jgi:hypothetical protein
VRFEYDERANLLVREYDAVTVPDLASGFDAAPDRQPLSERFAYNAFGQLVRAQDARGSVIEYVYYSLADPFGASGAPRGRRGGGLLAEERRHIHTVQPSGHLSRHRGCVTGARCMSRST